QALRINPNNAKTYNNRGNVRYDLGDKQGAMEDYTQALRINPNDANAYNNRGLAHRDMKDYQRAMEDYTQALRINPNNANAYYNRGNVRALLRDKQGAIEDYTQALQINPNNANAYYNRGNVRALLRDKQGAIEDYTQALQINPNNANAYYNRGNVRSALGDHKGANEDYTQALRINPNDVDTRKRLDILKAKDATLFFSAILCLIWLISISLHEFGHAIVAYWGGDKSVKAKGYLSLNPLKYTHPLISIILPGLFFLLGALPLPGAAVYIEHRQLRNRGWQSAVAAAGPFASLLVTLLLTVFFQVSLAWNLPYWFSAALAFFINLHLFFILFNLMPVPPLDGYGIIEPWLPEQLRSRLRKFTFLWLIFISTLPWFSSSFTLFFVNSVSVLSDQLGVLQRQAMDGFELFNRWYCALLLGAVGVFALIRQPQSVWHFLGDVLVRLKMHKMALVAYDKAIDRAPNVQFWKRRGLLLEKLERYDEAFINYNQAIELQPDNVWFWNERGLVLEKLGRNEEALINYNQAVKLQPDNVWAWNERGWVLEKLKRYDDALAAYNQTIQLQRDHDFAWYKRACIYALQSNVELAIENLQHAIELKPYQWRELAKTDSKFDKIREHERFQQLIDNY
ncbi:tetratricopeptide repeat protein, partial [Brasilonema sp. CT11]|nr:tetratricopeptide repeat protein [Brasilonema sp. CT11]